MVPCVISQGPPQQTRTTLSQGESVTHSEDRRYLTDRRIPVSQVVEVRRSAIGGGPQTGKVILGVERRRVFSQSSQRFQLTLERHLSIEEAHQESSFNTETGQDRSAVSHRLD